MPSDPHCISACLVHHQSSLTLLSLSQSTLEDMDMEDDMKTLVSDEIKRFRESYKVGVHQLECYAHLH